MVRISFSRAAGVHLVIDATVAHLDLESAHVTPGVVPGVDTEPVVLTILSAPTDSLDGVTTKSGASLVRVDAGLVGQEVLIDGEGGSDSTVLVNVSLDVVDAAEAIAAGGVVLVIVVAAGIVIDASLGAGRVNLLDIITGRKSLAGDVMGALAHSIVVAGATSAEVSTGDNTLFLEPFPRRTNLATVASHGLALKEVAAARSVSDREESGERATSRDANTIVEGFSGAVGPA